MLKRHNSFVGREQSAGDPLQVKDKATSSDLPAQLLLSPLNHPTYLGERRRFPRHRASVQCGGRGGGRPGRVHPLGAGGRGPGGGFARHAVASEPPHASVSGEAIFSMRHKTHQHLSSRH